MTIDELKKLAADKLVDARGTACPGPLLAAKQAISDVNSGGVMKILSTDPGTKRDVPRWATKQGHEYMGDFEEDGYFSIFLKKS